MKCILCIMAGLADLEIRSAEELKTAVAHAVDGARTAVTVTHANALCNEHIVSELLGFVV